MPVQPVNKRGEDDLERDLKTALASNAGEIQQLAIQRGVWQSELDEVAAEIKTQFQPRLQFASLAVARAARTSGATAWRTPRLGAE